MKDRPLWSLGASKMRALLQARECSAFEVVTSCLERINERESIVKAFVELDAKGALQRAKELDRGGVSGPLHGIPVGIKDTIDVAALHCIWGTEIHRDRVPSADAEVVRRRDGGARVLSSSLRNRARVGGT